MSDNRPHEDLVLNNLINTYSYLRRIGKMHNEIMEIFLLALLRGAKDTTLFTLQREAPQGPTSAGPAGVA